MGLHLYSLFTTLQLSFGNYSTIDFAFSLVFRRYVLQLARAAGYKRSADRTNVLKLDVRYIINVRYFAVLLSSDQHLFELHSNSERDLKRQTIFTDSLTRTPLPKLVARLTIMCGNPTYLMLRSGFCATPGAFAFDDTDLRQSVQTAAI